MEGCHSLYVQIWHEGAGPYRGAFMIFEGPPPAPPDRVLLKMRLGTEHPTPNAAQDHAWETAKRVRDELAQERVRGRLSPRHQP